MNDKTKQILNIALKISLLIIAMYTGGFVLPLVIGMIHPIISYMVCSSAISIAILCGLIYNNESNEK